METPKAGSTTMKWVLARMSGRPVHPRLPLLAETDLAMCVHDRSVHPLPALPDLGASEANDVLQAPDYQRVCIVRNPYTRLVSAWADKIRFREPGFEETCVQVLNHAGRHDAEEVPSFREFATWVVDTQVATECHDHWRDQTELNYFDLIDYMGGTVGRSW